MHDLRLVPTPLFLVIQQTRLGAKHNCDGRRCKSVKVGVVRSQIGEHLVIKYQGERMEYPA